MKWFQKKAAHHQSWDAINQALISLRGQGVLRGDAVQIRQKNLLIIPIPKSGHEIHVYISKEIHDLKAQSTDGKIDLSIDPHESAMDFLKRVYRVLHPQPFLRTFSNEISYPRTSNK